MDIGNKITELRKQKGWSQSDLAKAIDASRYIFEKGQHASYDKESNKRLEGIDSETRKTLFQVIDSFLRDSKARLAYS